jgi:integrin alpha FG-GAP repeat containing protein 1
MGDLNLDGFVDIVPIVATPSPGDRSKLAKTPKILGSVACGKGVAGCGSDGKGRRGWSMLGRDNNVLEEFQDARGVVLVDIDEDVSFASLCFPKSMSKSLMQGTLDVLVQRTGEQGQGNVWFVQNNFYYDAFFLKAIGEFPIICSCLHADVPTPVLNGGCPSGWCYTANGSRFHVRSPAKP